MLAEAHRDDARACRVARGCDASGAGENKTQGRREGWGDRHERHLEEIELINIKSDDELYETWKQFIHSHHYRTTNSYYDSIIGRSPRRSCEATWATLMDGVFIKENPIPKEADWEELYERYEVLLNDEKGVEETPGDAWGTTP